MSELYQEDFYSWAQVQAELLRRRASDALDWDNLADEIESLGKSQASELRVCYTVLLAHLLVWRVQPEQRCVSWENTIRTQRALIQRHLADNPGLNPKREALFTKAYLRARGDAATKMGRPLQELPEASPFSLNDVMDVDWWPEA